MKFEESIARALEAQATFVRRGFVVAFKMEWDGGDHIEVTNHVVPSGPVSEDVVLPTESKS